MSKTDKELYVRNVFPVPEPFAFFNVIVRIPDYRLLYHSHDRFHINCITEGSVDVITDSDRLTLNAGNTFVMPPHVEHELFSKHGYSQIGMDMDDVHDTYGLAARLGELCSGRAIKVKTDALNKDSITPDMLLSMSSVTALKCIIDMTRLLLNVIENRDTADITSEFKKEFTAIAEKSGDEKPSLAKLCSKMGYSKSHLERLVHREFGCSAVEYLERLRFLRVCADLSATDKKLSAIAEEYGFCDSAHLSVFFKKRSGVTPARYREESH